MLGTAFGHLCLHRRDNIAIAHLDFKGHVYIKKQIGVSLSLNESEIMDVKSLVHRLYTFDNKCLHSIVLGIVHNDGVHVYIRKYAKLTVEPLFDKVYHIVGLKNILRAVHLDMKVCNEFVRAVAMHHHIVNTKRIGLRGRP